MAETPLQHLSICCVSIQLLPLSPHCSNFPCIPTLLFLGFPRVLPYHSLLFFCCFQALCCDCHHLKAWPWVSLVAKGACKGLCLDGSVPRAAHNPSFVTRRRR